MTLSERIINRKSTVNPNTVFMSAPASSPDFIIIQKFKESRDGVAFRSLLTDNPAGTKVGAGLVPARSWAKKNRPVKFRPDGFAPRGLEEGLL